MGRAPCCDKANVKRGPWSPEEDTTLKNYLQRHGTGGNWIALPHKAGLKRCGKSCRLRWLNYLRPDIKHGGFTEEEDNIIFGLYRSMGSRWSVIASNLPGRTDNDVKNYWNTKLKKKFLATKSNENTTAKKDAIELSSYPSPHVVKTENFSTDAVWTPLSENSTSLSSIDVGFGYNVETQRLFSDPISFSMPILKESSDYGVNANGGYVNASSSLLPMDNSYCMSPWPASGNGGVIDEFLMDHNNLYGSPYDLLNGYGGFQTVATSETKPQGVLFQGVTY